MMNVSTLLPHSAPMPTRHRPNTKAAQAAATQADPRWAAVVERSTGADGTFWYSVQTTGVYCRPSCASRTPRPENVLFHASCDDAGRAGVRPCQRCMRSGHLLNPRKREASKSWTFPPGKRPSRRWPLEGLVL